MWLMLLFTLNLSASFKSYIIGSYQTLSDIYFDLKYIPKVVDVYIHIAFQRQFQTLQTSYQISGEIYVDVKYIRKVVDAVTHIAPERIVFKHQFQTLQSSYQISGDMLMRNILSPLEPRAAMHNLE